MKPIDIVILVIVAVAFVGITAMLVWKKKKGGSGCGCDCACCNACAKSGCKGRANELSAQETRAEKALREEQENKQES